MSITEQQVRAQRATLVALAGPRTHRRVIELMTAGPARGRVLDIPTGTGALAVQLHARGFEVQPADIDPGMFAAAPTLTCRYADMDRPLDFPDESFDWVACVEGVEHLEAPGHFLRECARVLAPGGRLVVTTPNTLNLPSRLRALLTGFPSLMRPIMEPDPEPAHDHVTPLPYPQLRGLLRRSGLVLEQVTTDCHRRGAWPLLLGYPLVAIATSRLLARLARKHPGPDYAQIRRHLLSLDLLLGRTLITVARKDG